MGMILVDITTSLGYLSIVHPWFLSKVEKWMLKEFGNSVWESCQPSG